MNAKSGKTFETFNPANGKKIVDVAEADAADVDVAVKVSDLSLKLDFSLDHKPPSCISSFDFL